MAHRGRGAGAASGRLWRVVLASRGGETQEGRAPSGTRPDRAPYPTNTSDLRVATERRLKGVNYIDNEERRLAVTFLKAVNRGKANAVYTITKQLFEYQAKKTPRTSGERNTNERSNASKALTKEELYKGVNEIKEAINQQLVAGNSYRS